jgi:hypothetical protein
VPDGEGDDIIVPLVEGFVVVEAAGKSVDDVARNRRLFRYDQRLHAPQGSEAGQRGPFGRRDTAPG